MPFFTIITATYNAAEHLPRLLASLAEQTYRDFEVIIQDGASTDETSAVVENWRKSLPACSFISQVDTGIYDAWNKALARQGETLGQWVLFLGADDALAGTDVLERSARSIACVAQEVILCVGTVNMVYPDNTVAHTITADIEHAFAHRYEMSTPLPHSGLFTRSETLQQQRFNINLKIAADYEWMLLVWKDVGQVHVLDFVITNMALGGISSNESYSFILRREQRAIMCRNFLVRFSNIHIFLFLYLESLLYTPKSILKTICSRFHFSQKIWAWLQKIRKKSLNIHEINRYP